MVANNPYGMDLMLAELIPSTSISSSSSVYNKFRPGSSDSETNMDSVTILRGTVEEILVQYIKQQSFGY